MLKAIYRHKLGYLAFYWKPPRHGSGRYQTFHKLTELEAYHRSFRRRFIMQCIRWRHRALKFFGLCTVAELKAQNLSQRTELAKLLKKHKGETARQLNEFKQKLGEVVNG